MIHQTVFKEILPSRTSKHLMLNFSSSKPWNRRQIWNLLMNRVRRIAGIGKPKVLSAVQKDKDESIVFFRELYKREKDKDVNLLEPMYSVEFEAIQGGHGCKVPPGKRDFLIPVDEKHDYDWLMTPPAAPLFPSIEIEAKSSQMVFQRELPIPPRQVKPPARLLAKPEATKTSTQSASPTSNSSSRKTFIKGAPAVSKEKKQPHTADQRSSHKVPVNGHEKAAIPGTRIGGVPKKHSERCYATQTGSTSTVKGVTDQETPFKPPKNLITTTRSLFRGRTPSAENAPSKDPRSGADVKKDKENGKAGRQSCPPAAIRGVTELQLQDRRDALPPRGKSVAGSGGELAAGNSGRAGRATLVKGTWKN